MGPGGIILVSLYPNIVRYISLTDTIIHTALRYLDMRLIFQCILYNKVLRSYIYMLVRVGESAGPN